ncbi:MAG: hypothetical protein ACRBN8_32240 [Nannocystales bacterium]
MDESEVAREVRTFLDERFAHVANFLRNVPEEASTRAMTIQRLQDLVERLQDRGCRILSEDEFPEGNHDPFVLEREQLVWGVLLPDGSVRRLTITAHDDLGRRTQDLRDIFDCVDEASGASLYFDKINSPQWTSNLQQFIWTITETHREGA